VSSAFELPFRIIVMDPPEGVTFAVQSGRTGRATLITPTRVTREAIVFNMKVQVTQTPSGGIRLSSPVVQGTPASRFVYVNSGTLAGQADSSWTRRAKVPLDGLTSELIEQAHASGAVIEIEIPGSALDGGPASATVAPRGGWRLGRR
jgi:hypothetical protein